MGLYRIEATTKQLGSAHANYVMAIKKDLTGAAPADVVEILAVTQAVAGAFILEWGSDASPSTENWADDVIVVAFDDDDTAKLECKAHDYQRGTLVVESGITARYWRVLITDTNGSNIVGISEIEMRATIGGADQCSGGTADSSSDFDSNHVSAMAFDDVISGSSGNIWASHPSFALPAWISYDFGVAVFVEELLITNRDANSPWEQSPQDFELQYSSDNTNWATLDSYSGLTTWGNLQTKTFTVQ